MKDRRSKFCVGCKWFKSFNRCYCPSLQSKADVLIGDKDIWTPASMQRESSFFYFGPHCGPEGKYWENKSE